MMARTATLDDHPDRFMNRPPPHEYAVPASLAGERLDRAIAALASGVSRGEARRLIAAGVVFVDGKRTGIQSRAVRAGERISWHAPAAPADPARAAEPRIVVERPDLWIVDKPAGMPVEATRTIIDKPAGMPIEATRTGSRGTLHDWLVRARGAAFVTHRLDAATSGLIVVARDARAQAALNHMFADHAIRRRYLAVVTPPPSWDQRTLDESLDGRAAITHARVAARAAAAAVLVLRLETGRSRQIRRHLAGAGYPVVGERADGERTSERLLLHAFELGLPARDWGAAPRDPLVATAAPPADFREPAAALGLASADLEAAVASDHSPDP